MAETRFTHPTKVSRPAFTIPKEKKKKPIAPIPGPSDYDTSKNEHSKGALFGNSPRYVERKQLSPGPGQYSNQKVINSIPAYSIRKAKVSNNRQSLPGPADYSPDKKIQGVPQYSFSTQLKKSNSENTVGPGSYNTNRESPGKYGQGLKFPASGRNAEKTFESPGPASYSIERNFIDHNGHRFSESRLGKNKTVLPGPGQYDIERTSLNKAGAIFPTQRNLKMKYMTPGPGDYNTSTERPNQIGFTMKKGNQSSRTERIPGPSDYNIKFGGPRVSNPTIGRAPARDLSPLSPSPGPGYYGSKTKDERAIGGNKFSIGNTKRWQPTRMASPGPGDYDASPILRWNKGPQLSIAKAKNIFHNSATPGPGDYNTSHLDQKGPSLSFSKSVKSQKPQKDISDSYTIPAAFPNAPKYAL